MKSTYSCKELSLEASARTAPLRGVTEMRLLRLLLTMVFNWGRAGT